MASCAAPRLAASVALQPEAGVRQGLDLKQLGQFALCEKPEEHTGRRLLFAQLRFLSFASALPRTGGLRGAQPITPLRLSFEDLQGYSPIKVVQQLLAPPALSASPIEAVRRCQVCLIIVILLVCLCIHRTGTSELLQAFSCSS